MQIPKDIAKKFKGMAILGPMLEEKLFDPSDSPTDLHWVPLNKEAEQLGCCLEACRQLATLRPLFEKSSNARSYTLLTTPAWNLVENTIALHKLLGKKDRSYWLPLDVEAFTETGRTLRKLASGSFKKIRDQRSAHNDPSALHPSSRTPVASPDLVLPPLKNALVVLVLSLNHNGTFGYCRLPDPSKRKELQIMFEYPIATTVRLGEDRKIEEVLECQLAADPRHEAESIVKDAIHFYNDLTRGTRGIHPAIVLKTHEPSLEKFKDGKFTAKIFEMED